ncbi:MAG: D-alanine--D-alanine ligase A, partial [Desulfomonile tiedjei]|nr:D-alanine--D-alanine ligase A [Desulfomonile tiedjei]
MQSSILKIALIYGGRSAEHEVSLRSALSVFDAIDRSRFEPIPVLITQNGAWYRMASDAGSFSPGATTAEKDRLLFSPDPEHR